MKFRIHPIQLPSQRPFSWRAFGILVALYFVGNLAAVPLLRATDVPIEPVWYWGVFTAISAIVIGLSLILASRSALGAPYIEGLLGRGEIQNWFKSALALTVLVTTAVMPFSLLINLNIHPTRYPAGWQLVLASLKAGTVEEIVYRFFVVSLFSWLGGLIRKNSDGRPVELVYLSAILLAGLIFGWAHVDAKLSAPGVSVFPLAIIMTLSTILGIYFGWILWKFGLEWAIIAHFLYDALFSAVVMPAYLSNNQILWVAITIGFLIICVLSWRYLTREA